MIRGFSPWFGIDRQDVQVIDANFAKLAAKGLSIMISSGDSGSGYTVPSMCLQKVSQVRKSIATV